ncbi:MAG: hypothetical protein INR65_02690, partial [Gluconacetobacter diazotrophicus]|nr:hypothetical protein [Gluconacetobacter diazotrophicus]
ALSAIAISVISLVVAVEHGRTERKLVTAATWPFAEVENERTGRDGQYVSELILRNAGVGPARLVSLVVRLDGKVVRSPAELLTSCCGVPAGTTTETRPDYGVMAEGGVLGILEAHQAQNILWVGSKADAVRRGFEAAWPRLTYDACYCSVLNECWRSDLKSTGTPVRVALCRPSADDYQD